jgi:hypothetical protein
MIESLSLMRPGFCENCALMTLRFAFLPISILCLNCVASPGQGASLTSGGLPVERLSSGALILLDRDGDLVRWPDRPRPRLSSDTSLTAGLDPRVGPNIRLGDDPASLPANLRAQAEPHIARHPSQPDILAATFQEGRYTDGGCVDCGYSISQDGGLTWSRALIPGVTTNVGGIFLRASDPVAGIDSNGSIYLNVIAIIDPAESMSAVLISRSTNGGATFDPPVEIARSPANNVFLDKNWMAINTFPATPTAGRIVASWTRFGPSANPIVSTHSDDHGRTWSAPIFATPSGSFCQGSQPIFLANGKLACVYWNFGTTHYEVVVSTNAGVSFGAALPVAAITSYDPVNIRSGSFLCSVATDRTNGVLYMTSQAFVQSAPRIIFTKSSDGGTTWTPIKVVSDNPASTSVFNPAIAVSPDGQVVTISFYDGRVNPGQSTLVDLFYAQSFDGGVTWQPNVRVSAVSTDATLMPLTSEGYMLGDYLGIAPAAYPNIPAVPVWIDTRTGNPDPFIGRVGVSSNITFQAWRAARFSLAQINNTQAGGPGADPDSDAAVNALEYAFGQNPQVADRPVFTFGRTGNVFSATYSRIHAPSDLAFNWYSSTNLATWAPLGVSEIVSTNANLRLDNVKANLGTNVIGTKFFRLGVGLNN